MWKTTCTQFRMRAPAAPSQVSAVEPTNTDCFEYVRSYITASADHCRQRCARDNLLQSLFEKGDSHRERACPDEGVRWARTRESESQRTPPTTPSAADLLAKNDRPLGHFQRGVCRRAKCKSTAEITFKKRRTARYSASKPHVAFASTAPWVCAVRRCRAHLRSHLDALTHPGNGARGRIDQHCSCGVHGRLSYRICSRWPFRPTDEPLASASDLCNY